MASKVDKGTEKMIEVTAKVNLKYDNEIKKIGDKLNIRESDLKNMQEKGYIDYTAPIEPQETVVPPAN